MKQMDTCVLNHYEIRCLLGFWQSTCNDGRDLVPESLGRKFPFQMKVELAIPKITETPAKLLAKLGVNAFLRKRDASRL